MKWYCAFLQHTKRTVNYLINDSDDLQGLLVGQPRVDLLLARLVTLVLDKLAVPEKADGRQLLDT